MDSVITMTKQGVRNLNNLGPKKKKVVAEAQPAEGESGDQADNAGKAGEQVQVSEQSAPQTDAPSAASR
jgi:protein-tyrosine-phosphatase